MNCRRRPGHKGTRSASLTCRKSCVGCWGANLLPVRHCRRPFLPSCVTGNLPRIGPTKNNSSRNGRGSMSHRRRIKRPVNLHSKPPTGHGNAPLRPKRTPLALRPANAMRNPHAVSRTLLNKENTRPRWRAPRAGVVRARARGASLFGAIPGRCAGHSSLR